MDVRVGLWRKLSAKELMLLNCVLEKTLGSPLDCKEIQPVHSEGDQSWVFIGRTDAKAETPILWPPHAKSWPLEKTLMLGGIGGRRRRGRQRMRWLDGITDWWTWIWVNSGSWWWTGRPGVLWFMGSQTVGHNLATELNWFLLMGTCVQERETIITSIYWCAVFRKCQGNSVDDKQ